jgi:hypothetical protein
MKQLLTIVVVVLMSIVLVIVFSYVYYNHDRYKMYNFGIRVYELDKNTGKVCLINSFFDDKEGVVKYTKQPVPEPIP